MQHTIIALVHDSPSVLNRAVSVFRRHGLNIDSFTLARTEQPGVSRMTCVCEVPDVAPVIAQLEKLLDVLEVREMVTADTPAMPTRPEPPRSMFAISQADGLV